MRYICVPENLTANRNYRITNLLQHVIMEMCSSTSKVNTPTDMKILKMLGTAQKKNKMFLFTFHSPRFLLDDVPPEAKRR